MPQEAQTIVILKSNEASLKPVEAYLANRGFVIYSTHNMREALSLVIQKNPQFIMLAADHPNSRVKSLPKLLRQAFIVPIIAFLESSTNHSIASIHEMGMEYNIYPPVSGPAIERMFLKIQKDLEAQKIKSEKVPESPEEQAKAARSMLEQIINANESEVELSKESESVIIQKGNAGTKINYNPSQKSSDSLSATEDGNAGNFVSSWDPNQKENKNSSGHLIMPEADKTKNPSLIQTGRKPKPSLEVIFGNEDSIIVKGTQAALDETVIVRSPVSEQQIPSAEVASYVACLAIDSSRFSGYLVAALGKDRKIDEAFMELVKDKLFSFLRSYGENIDFEQTPMNLKLEKVEFDAWAAAHAEFLRKSIHDDDEIAMAFFPTKTSQLVPETSVKENMMMLRLDEIPEGTKVDFDVFIYLPQNDKFVLYTPEGQSLLSGQKDRLKSKGVTHLHLRKNQLPDVRRYRARVFLSEQIEAFKNLKTIS